MVVGHLGVVEHLLRLVELLSFERGGEHLVVCQSLQDAGALGVDVVAQVGRVDTRIGRHLLLIERLDGTQGVVGGVGELLVALHLQRREVEEAGRCFRAVLLGHLGYGERLVLDAVEQGLSRRSVHDGRNAPVGILFPGFLLRLRVLFLLGFLFSQLFVALADEGREDRVAIGGLQFPVLFRHEVLDFQLTVDNECQRRCLHPSDGKHLTVLPVLQRVEACGVHAQHPVADGTGKSCLVERLELFLVLQVGEPFADGLLGE